MPIPKKHHERIHKFTEICLGKVTREETERVFFLRGRLDNNYTIALYSTGLLPQGNDDTIEISGDCNDKSIGKFYITGESLASHKLDDKLVKDVAQAFIKLKIKEIK
ncbi:hypothetical protein OBP_036 [Pseudomonas phage OBP]|uniref:hypothetical protein n=1 Tax=Pseudomonas phage OBP TaxID=1124849 RepID=UPI000240D621|nr:hypothetical protein OBP_036 [Pseudomonas phage OBP]AEV89473.1 hypothetical protein OBP_036 [Pseudomonas phage OBP]